MGSSIDLYCVTGSNCHRIEMVSKIEEKKKKRTREEPVNGKEKKEKKTKKSKTRFEMNFTNHSSEEKAEVEAEAVPEVDECTLRL